jgi:hypothetical protein
MKRLVLKSALFAALLLFLMLSVLLLPLPYNDDLSAILNKRDLLKDNRRDRIIFVGGSGLYSALDSAKVEERLGRRVVNMGLWAGFAITPLLDEIRPSLHPGDVVVVIPEYGRSFDQYLDLSRRWLFVLSPFRTFPKLYGTFPAGPKDLVRDLAGLVRSKFEALPHAFGEARRSRSCGVFTSRGYVEYGRYFNAQGDSSRIFPEAPSPEQIQERGANFFADPSYSGQSFERLSTFCRNEAAKGITTYFVFPAYPVEEYRRFRAGLKAYEARLRTELACTILGTPEDFLYPYGLFTDTIHHLGIRGRALRTDRLISLLRSAPAIAHTSDSSR